MNAPAPSPADEPEALQAFIAKWRVRWPEWSLAEVFVPRPQRLVALAWAALQQELMDAAWGGSDARPGEAKLLWWQEELHGWSLGRRRHPLGEALQRQRAPWGDLGAALPTLQDSRERPSDAAEAFERLLPLATAAAAIEQALFADAPFAEEFPGEPPARLLAATWLQARLARTGALAAPLSALARHPRDDDPDAVETAWRQELVRAWPAAGQATRPRRLWAAIARARIARGSADQPLAAWPALWTAWRAARN